jgi:hypothetical protein
MLPLIAILLPIMLIFLGFAVDLAYMQTTRMELLAAADSAARAGATKLSQTDDQDQARAAAKKVANQNKVAGDGLQLRDDDIEIGRSSRDGSGKWVFTTGGSPANSVRILAKRTQGSASGPVSLFFGSLVGTRHFEPVRTSTASFLNVDICLVLDRSTSMKLGVNEFGSGLSTSDPRMCKPANDASRWTALDSAVRVFIDELNNTEASEQVAIATYAGDGPSKMPCGLLPPSTLDCALTTNLKRVSSAMDALTGNVWNGFTFIESGMRTGLSALQDSRLARSGAEKIMIVLTDGNENVGSAMSAVRAITAAKITIYTITFSKDANKTLMKNVAKAGGGQHYHADNSTQLRQIFRDLAAQSTRLTE